MSKSTPTWRTPPSRTYLSDLHANAAWLVLAVIAFNLTRAASVIADQAGRLARATTATISRTLVAVRAPRARSARGITLHLSEARPWHNAFAQLFTVTHLPPPTAGHLTVAAARARPRTV